LTFRSLREHLGISPNSQKSNKDEVSPTRGYPTFPDSALDRESPFVLYSFAVNKSVNLNVDEEGYELE